MGIQYRYRISLKYDVGLYGEHRRLVRGKNTGLDSHHAGQKDIMKDLVADYDPKMAPAILVPKKGHTIADLELPIGKQTVSRKKINPNTDLPFTNARDLIARDIRELRRVYPDIPNYKLQELVELNKFNYPEVRLKSVNK
ncbi:hypothetical protein HQQ94_00990 [Shewanella sp. VB17]|nr:hypothetical protein [Shewanella sp. VB17]